MYRYNQNIETERGERERYIYIYTPPDLVAP